MNSKHTRCQSKNPASCRYHGTHAERMILILRSKVKVAQSVYQAAISSTNLDDQFNAYESLRSAEIEYYATDEGAGMLNQTLANAGKGDYRDMLIGIKTLATELREKHEQEHHDRKSGKQIPALVTTHR